MPPQRITLEESIARGQRMMMVREASGLNKQEFAKNLEISPSYVTFLERGVKGDEIVQVSDALLYMMAHKYGVSFTWLKSGKGSMRPMNRQRLSSLVMTLPDETIEEIMALIESKDGGR